MDKLRGAGLPDAGVDAAAQAKVRRDVPPAAGVLRDSGATTSHEAVSCAIIPLLPVLGFRVRSRSSFAQSFPSCAREGLARRTACRVVNVVP